MGRPRGEILQFQALVAHFFRRFFQNPLLAEGSDLRGLAAEILAPLGALGGLVCLLVLQHRFYLSFIGRRIDPSSIWVNQTFFIAASMILAGFVVLGKWSILTLSRDDWANLAPLPITPRLLFLAQATSLLALVGVLSAGANLFSALLFPSLAAEVSGGFLTGVWLFSAHLLVLLAANLSVFCFFVGIQGLLQLLPARLGQAASQLVRAAALLLFFSVLLTLPQGLRALPSLKLEHPARLFLVPPLWFAGLERTLLGTGDGTFEALGRWALWGLSISVLLAATAYVVQYRRVASGSEEDVSTIPLASPAMIWISRLVSRDPVQRAVASFVGVTLVRAALPRLVWGSFCGFGLVAAVLLAARGDPSSIPAFAPGPHFFSLAAGQMLLVLVTAGARVAFSLPVSFRSGWLFETTEQSDVEAYWSAVWKLLAGFLVLPQALLWGFLGFPEAGWRAPGHSAILLVQGLILVELLLFNYRKLPFVCAFVPERVNLKLFWPVYGGAGLLFVFGGAALERVSLGTPAGFGLGLTFWLIFWVAVRRLGFRYRRRHCPRTVVFRERPEPAVTQIRDYS